MLSYDYFCNFKQFNKDLLPELRTFANNLDFKPTNKKITENKYKNKNTNHRNINNKNICIGKKSKNICTLNNNNIKFGETKNDNNNKIHNSMFSLDKKFNDDNENDISDKIKGLLNKLSLNNVNIISKKLNELNINNKENINMLIDMILVRAISEIKFTNVYAKLSYSLIIYYNNIDTVGRYFKETLLNNCQKLFLECVSIDKDLLLDGKKFNSKNNILSFISYIGHLYMENILSTNITDFCIRKMIENIDEKKSFIVESIDIILNIIHQKFYKQTSMLCDIVQNLEFVLSKNINLETKDKFILINILENIKKIKKN